MAVIVLGIDGLDYYLVKKFNLKNLLQTNYGKIHLKEFSQIITHPIWASIISGKLPEEHGIRTTTRWKNPIIQEINNLLSLRNRGIEKFETTKRNLRFGEIAKKLKTSPRAVGQALKANKNPKIPCHRVVFSNKKIGGYNRGIKKKIQLLKKEGVIIKKGRIVAGFEK